MVEQPYQARLAEGMIRAYLTHDRVVGFAQQYPRGLSGPEIAGEPRREEFDLAVARGTRGWATGWSPKWVPSCSESSGLERGLPVIWDATSSTGRRTTRRRHLRAVRDQR